MAATHFRRSKIEDYVTKLRVRKAVLKNQLEQPEFESLRKIIQGELKAVELIIKELAQEFQIHIPGDGNRSIDDAIKELHELKEQGTPDEDLEVEDIIRQVDDHLLVRVVRLVKMGDKYYPGVSYDCWRGWDNYKAKRYSEGNRIYCTSMAMNEKEALEAFERMVQSECKQV